MVKILVGLRGTHESGLSWRLLYRISPECAATAGPEIPLILLRKSVNIYDVRKMGHANLRTRHTVLHGSPPPRRGRGHGLDCGATDNTARCFISRSVVLVIPTLIWTKQSEDGGRQTE